jgi:flagellar protein FlaJ
MDDVNAKPKLEKASKSKESIFDVYSKKAKFLFHKLKMTPFIILGDKMKEREDKYYTLKKELKQARMSMSYEMYLSNIIFYSILAGLAGAILGLIVAFLVIVVIGLPDQITNLTFSQELAWILDFKELIVGTIIFIFLTLALGGTPDVSQIPGR